MITSIARPVCCTIALWGLFPAVKAQCTDYDIIVGGGAAPGEIHWELMDAFGNIVASGDAPENTGECLDDGCYTMIMYDDGNNGWQGGTWSINFENTAIVVASGTLASGGYGTAQIDLNGGCGSGGCQDFLIDVTAGSSPNDVYWELVDGSGVLMASGGAPATMVVCLNDGCYTLYLYDSGGDGWQGGDYTITELAGGTIITQGTLASGAYGTSQVIIGTGCGSCDVFDITVSAGSAPGDVSWDLYDEFGNFIAAGGAPALQSLCLPAACYTFYAYDAGNDGWNGAQFTVTDGGGGVVSNGTLISGGFGSFQVSIGGACSVGTCTDYSMVVTSGSAPAEVSWSFSNMGTVYGSGWAPSTVSMCLDTGCYVMHMFDAGGNGWNGATWTLYDSGGVPVQSGTLVSGSTDAVAVNVGGTGTCTVPVVVSASDCPQAVNVCTNLNFTIDPSGWGAIWEIPALGSTSNPQFMWGDGIMSPWGTDHYGCLMGQEINTTWMIVNVSGSGSLEFTLGANNAQAGFYDWIMFPYTPSTCGQILANTVAPVRCNWNYSSSGGTGIVSTVPPGGFPENYETPLNVTAGQRYIICFSNWSSVTTVVPLVFGGTATVSCDPVVLPVEFLGFSAAAHEDVVRVDWATASELNTSHFIVQRSSTGETWADVTRVEAAGSSLSMREYHSIDPLPIEGGSFYRLLSVDNDGSRDIAGPIPVHWSTATLRLWPNPGQDDIWLDLGEHADLATVIVSDGTGKRLNVPLQRASLDEVRLSVRGLPPGVYSVVATDGGWLRATRLVVILP